METFIYWLLVLGYYLLGLVAGLIIVGLFYPPIRTFPRTAMLVFGRVLRISAITNLLWAMIFPIILLAFGYFLLNLFTPAYDVIKSSSFLVGFVGTFLITLLNGGFRRAYLSSDYAEFMAKHSALPEGVSGLHIMIAAAMLQYAVSDYNDPLYEQKGNKVSDLIETLDFSDKDEELLIAAMRHLRVKDADIEFVRELYHIEREYVEGQRQREIEQLEDDRRERQYQAREQLEDEEFEKQIKEWEEEARLFDDNKS